MVISHKYKYIFIGLPFGASSAITRELMHNYDGESLFDKHANIPVLLKAKPEINIKDYFVFVVVRDPIEMSFTHYNKFLTNAYQVFTDPQYFIENGGFVDKASRNFYHKFHEKKRSFEDFLKMKYRYRPYDNNLSLNAKYLNGWIDFDNLNEDFQKILKQIGVPVLRELPMYNRTKKVSTDKEISPALKRKIFGPFLNYNKQLFPGEKDLTVSAFDKFIFKVFKTIRDRKILNYDLSQMNNEFSIKNLESERP